MFKTQESAHSHPDSKWLAHEILKSNFELVGRKFVRYFVAVEKMVIKMVIKSLLKAGLKYYISDI